MLSASWALFRSSWAHVGRYSAHGQLRTLPHLLPTTSAYGVRRGATLSIRHTQSIGEPVEEPIQKVDSDYPIDILNSKSTLRTLIDLVVKGKQDEATAAMADFLASVPSDVDLDAFDQLKKLLLENPEDNLTLIMQLGVGYAAMGHAGLVKKELLPVVKGVATSDLLSHFESNIENPRKAVAAVAKNVFEETSDDYTPFLSAVPTPELSLTELIAQQLPAILPEPSEHELTQLFEEEGEEYLSFASTTTAEAHSAMQSAGVLAALVQEERYDQAYTLLKEIRELGIPIPPSLLYELPAQAALQNEKLHPAERIDLFTAWFSLIPPAHETQSSYNFEDTRRIITQAPLTNISLFIRFALIMARKGFADKVSLQTIPMVMRCTSWEICEKFLEEFNGAYADYLVEIHAHNAKYSIKKTLTNTRGIAVRSLAYAGRVEEAIKLLPDPENPTFRLTTYTYNVLLRKLMKARKAIRDKYVALVKGLRDGDLTSIPLPQSSLQALRALSQEHELAAENTSAGPLDFGNDLVLTLRYLKKYVVSEDKSLLPHPFTLVNFMSMYLATGRTRALKMLLDKAIRHSFIATSNFVFAEMLFYRRLKQPNLVVKTFVDHFFLSGVPREEVVRRIIRIDSQINNYDPATGEDPPLKRFYPFDESFTLPRGKIWPGRMHCNLVWDALADLTTGDGELELLYYKLIRYVQDGKDSPESSIISSVDELPSPAGWITAAGPAAFTPFIYRMMYNRGPQFGVRMFRDMLQLGIKPTAYHYTELAGYFARKDEVQKVFLILDGMEGKEWQPFGEETYAVESRGLSPPIRKYHLPAPTLVTYVSLMRGFLIAKNLKAAEKVYQRLIQVHQPVPGENRLLDQALHDLSAFRKAPRDWVYPFAGDRD